MKKVLFASSALAALAFAGQAQASDPIKLSVGGYMEQWAGIASQDDSHADRNAFQSDTEVHFTGETTLDNGIQVGAHIELEGQTSNDQIDEQYLYVNGNFGQFKIGEDDPAADDMGIQAPTVGPVGVTDGDLSLWTDSYMPDTIPGSGDDEKVTYFSPTIAGFRVGVSYTSKAGSHAGKTGGGNLTTDGKSTVGGGITYEHDFGGVNLAMDVVGENSGDGAWYGAGAKVGFGNFTVGGSYSHIDDDYANIDSTDNTDSFDLGVAYAMDAASVSLAYAHSNYGYNNSTQSNADTLAPTGNFDTVSAGLAYTLGAGVTWKSSVFWFDDDNDNATYNNDGYGAVTGIRLDF